MTQVAFAYDVTLTYVDSSAVQHTVNVSTHGRTTGGFDPVPNTHFAEAVRGITFERYMHGAGSPRTRGPVQIGTGVLDLANADGSLDAIVDESFDDQRLTLWAGQFPARSGGYAFEMSAADDMPYYVEAGDITDQVASFYLRDGNYKLLAKALPDVYAGSNSGSPLAGVEGTANDIKGQRKPAVYGITYNIAPVLVNTTRLIYQVDGQNGLRTGWSLTVKDQGVALTAGAAYTDQADMEANAPTAGQYRVWVAGGCFRLGSTPTGAVTCDCTNPSSTADTYPVATTGNEIHAIAMKLLVDAGVLVYGDLGAQAQYLEATPEMGVYVTGEVSWLDVLNQLAHGINASFVVIDDYLMFSQVDTGGAASSLTLTDADVLAIRRVVPADDDHGKPAWRVTVRYKRNWRPMADAEVAGAVSQADRAFLALPYRDSVSEDTGVKLQWPNAVELVFESLAVDATEAADEAARLLALFKEKRACYEVSISIEFLLLRNEYSPPLQLELGKLVTLDMPRFDLSGGKDLQIIGRRFDVAAGTLTLWLWG